MKVHTYDHLNETCICIYELVEYIIYYSSKIYFLSDTGEFIIKIVNCAITT